MVFPILGRTYHYNLCIWLKRDPEAYVLVFFCSAFVSSDTTFPKSAIPRSIAIASQNQYISAFGVMGIAHHNDLSIWLEGNPGAIIIALSFVSIGENTTDPKGVVPCPVTVQPQNQCPVICAVIAHPHHHNLSIWLDGDSTTPTPLFGCGFLKEKALWRVEAGGRRIPMRC